VISIVFVGRNDNYGGDFEQRLLSTAHHNMRRLTERGVEAELIFVEWNPIEEEPLLSEKVATAIPQARCFVVDGLVHRLISGNRHLKVFEYQAKNIGARQARGDWLLLMNPDNFFGDDILDFLQTGDFDPGTFYRAGWIDIESETDVNRTDLTDFYAYDAPPYPAALGDFFFCAK